MVFCRVENGVVTDVGLPNVGILADGSTVSGYNALPVDVLAAEGWLPLTDDTPEWNTETEMLTTPTYTVTETGVTVVYTVESVPALAPNPVQLVASTVIAAVEAAPNTVAGTQTAIITALSNFL